jgi:DNA-nicking Smr family endonuclease
VAKKKDKPPKDGPFAKLAELKKKMADDEASAKKPAPKKPGPAPRAKEAAPPGDEDEAMTFHRLMSGVVPLDRPGARSGEAAKKVAEGRLAQKRQEEEARERLRGLVFPTARFEVTDDGRRVEGRRVDVPPDVVRRLRRGMLPIDARLDLHGMREHGAKEALGAFLRDKRTRGERCVLVIHGRGEHSPGPPVLRGEIAAWLSQGPASEHVAAFATAQEDDGGEGAVYVLLRR